MKKGNLLVGIAAGLAVGAALGVLFAPAKGSETRKKIAGKGNDLADALKKKFDDLVDNLTGDPVAASEEKSESQ